LLGSPKREDAPPKSGGTAVEAAVVVVVEAVVSGGLPLSPPKLNKGAVLLGDG
jgi:hypothetical protein